MPKINFAAVKGVEPVPADTYLASIVEAKEGTSKAGEAKIDVQWKIEGGKFDGRRVFETWSFHPNALFRVKNNLIALGLADKHSQDDIEVTPDMLIGKTAMIVVIIDVSGGTDDSGEPYEPRNNVKKVKPVKAGEAAAATGGGLFGRSRK